MMEEEKAYSLSLSERKMEKETRPLVEWLFLKSRLGKHATLVLHLLQEPVALVVHNCMRGGEGNLGHEKWQIYCRRVDRF